MRFLPTTVPEVILIEPDVFRDARGFFLETFHARKYREAGLDCEFVQDNHSRSARATLRGLHAQLRKPQGKLIRVVEGEIFDVALDIRPDSKSFGRWVSSVLSSQNFHQLFVPPGFAHGFCVLSESAQVEYKCSDFYDRDDEIGIRWDSANIAWPLRDPLLSAKDAALPSLEEFRRSLESVRR
jgi:dTDP-4-dehydrorhamnose 3,5-epimerase